MPANEHLADLNAREYATLVPLVLLAFWIGIYPKPLFTVLEGPVRQIVEQVNPGYYNPARTAQAIPTASQTPAPALGAATERAKAPVAAKAVAGAAKLMVQHSQATASVPAPNTDHRSAGDGTNRPGNNSGNNSANKGEIVAKSNLNIPADFTPAAGQKR